MFTHVSVSVFQAENLDEMEVNDGDPGNDDHGPVKVDDKIIAAVAEDSDEEVDYPKVPTFCA